jgi:Ca2+-binding EF-hand superfamily protein
MKAAVAPLSPGPLSPGGQKQTATIQLRPKTSSGKAKPQPSPSMRVRVPPTPSKSSTAAFPASPSSADADAAASILTSPVFMQTRAKKLFAAFDSNGDKQLSRDEFTAGLTSFVASLRLGDEKQIDISPAHVTRTSTGELTLSAAQLDALWKETDLDCDGRISLPEFLFRFAGGPDPRAASLPRQTQPLQAARRQDKDSTRMTLDDLRSVLDAVYDGPNVRFKAVDLSKTEQISAAVLKRIMTQTLQAEKEQAQQQQRPMEDFAAHCLQDCGGLTQRDVDRLFAAIDVKKAGRIDLGPIFALASQKPGRLKSKKKKLNPNYLFSTVKEEHFRDFINDCLLSALSSSTAGICCHPPLLHWGDEDRRLKGMQGTGYKQAVLLSERTRIMATTRTDSGFAVYVLFRTEITELKRMESLCCGLLRLDGHEVFSGLQWAVKKQWRDGEVEKYEQGKDVVEKWSQHCGDDSTVIDGIELSIPLLIL